MRLPGSERAEVDHRKLADYCLSPTHPVGKHKALVFASALGLTSSEAGTLREWLLHAAATGDAVEGRTDEFGRRFTLDFAAVSHVGRATIRSVWIIRTDEFHPRLTTCWVLPGSWS